MEPLDGHNGEDEINVEGYALKLVARFPFDDPAACREIYKQMGIHLEESLKNRAARHARGSPGVPNAPN